jgi:chromosome segregation ATPase
MPAIGDQVASLEHDHAEALARIDSLVASNAALTSANAALTNEAIAKIDSLTASKEALESANAALTSENAALNKYADEIKAMVESVASGALKMLQAARAPIMAEVAKVAAEIKPLVLDVTGFLGDITEEHLPATPEEIDEQDAGNANALSSGDSGDEHHPPVVDIYRPIADKIRAEATTIEAKIADIPDAVERMLHHSSASSAPPVTALRMPVDMTMIVEHDAGGLPMFLRRGTTFDALARARFDT